MDDIGASKLPEDKIKLEEIERKIILNRLYDAIEFLHNKAVNKRIQEKEHKFVKLRVDMFKAMAYIATSYNALARDLELEKIKCELDELKQLLKE